VSGGTDTEVANLFAARAARAELTQIDPPVVTRVILSVVVPLFEEEANLPELLTRLRTVLYSLKVTFEIVLVNDGSRDRTGLLLDLFSANDPTLVVVHLSRNFGHQAAVAAGLASSQGLAVVVLDGDLQDPPELIPELFNRWRSGSEVVYAVRAKRDGAGLLQPVYQLFYRLLNKWADHPIPLDSGDFCLMDRKVTKVLTEASEQPRFLRGLRAYAGFRQTAVPYHRPERFAGRSKYTLSKLFGLALDGFFHFTRAPVRLMWYLAGVTAILFVMNACYVVGWNPSQLPQLALYLIAAFGMAGLAIVTEYLSRILREVQHRPAFIVREVRRSETVPRGPEL